MGALKNVRFISLNPNNAEQVIMTIETLSACFPDRDRYNIKRLTEELRETDSPFYRHFIIAVVDDVVVGAGGIKAVDWASNTHALYLSAVAQKFRGRGIGKQLVKSRLDWIKSNFETGRILVSTSKIDRFKSFGFKQISQDAHESKVLMLKEF